MRTAKIALVLVILVDIMGQGLAFPIFSVLLLTDQGGMLAADTPQSTRQLLYGVLVGVFFLAWFFGAIYVSRISDSVGRKRGILICLTGTIAGYALAFVAILVSSFWLLLLSRAVTGFTAGNQPIAQAALVDLSVDEADKARNMGLVMLGAGIGLVAGPIIGGVFSSGAFGSIALLLPFLVGGALIGATMVIVLLYFEETSTTRVPLSIHPAAVFTLLWEVTRRPVIWRISVAFLAYMLSFVVFYVFFDTALERWFGYGTTEQAAGMLALGITMAVASTLVLPKIARWIAPRPMIVGFVLIEIAVIALFVMIEQPVVAFLCIAAMGFIHAFMYPTFLGLFSAAASAEDQGWVMGVAVALFTLSSAVASLAGGLIGAADFDAMFAFAIAGSVATLAAIALLWRTPNIGAPSAST